MSPAVAALLQWHASARKGLDDTEASTSNEGAAAAEAADSEQHADLEEHVGPETLPAGLTGLILKGCGATEAGAETAVLLRIGTCLLYTSPSPRD